MKSEPHKCPVCLGKGIVWEPVLNSTYLPEEEDELNFLTIDETSKFLNLAKQTIYGHVCTRKLGSYKRGKKLYFLKEELIEFLKLGRRKSLDQIE